MMKNPQADKISDYLKSRTEARITGRQEPFEIDGKRQELPVFRLPLDMLRYNIRNGRFAAELRELEASEGRRLDPARTKDATLIEDLLLRDATRADWLRRDIKRVGQLQPATITHDGYIINGNRRAAVLNGLHRQTGDQHYAFLEVVRLPANVSASDLWRFEAGFQLAVELKADYGPVNELLKIKEGQEYGLKDAEIALILGGDNTAETVQKKVKRLELVEDYLSYFGQDKRYSLVERRVEHFINVVDMMGRTEWKKLNSSQQAKLLHAVYHMIHDAELAHLEIRKVGSQIMKDTKAALEWANEVLRVSGAKKTSKGASKETGLTVEPLQDEIAELEAKLVAPKAAPAVRPSKEKDKPEESAATEKPGKASKEKLKELFDATVEKVALVQQKKKPGQILKRIEANLQALGELSARDLKSFSKEFRRIEALTKKLGPRFR